MDLATKVQNDLRTLKERFYRNALCSEYKAIVRALAEVSQFTGSFQAKPVTVVYERIRELPE